MVDNFNYIWYNVVKAFYDKTGGSDEVYGGV
jgi:hypothetical protein